MYGCRIIDYQIFVTNNNQTAGGARNESVTVYLSGILGILYIGNGVRTTACCDCHSDTGNIIGEKSHTIRILKASGSSHGAVKYKIFSPGHSHSEP